MMILTFTSQYSGIFSNVDLAVSLTDDLIKHEFRHKNEFLS